MGFQSIKRILPESLQLSGIAKAANAARVVELATDIISRLWGPERARYVEVVSLRDGILHIRVTSPAASQELQTFQTEWMNELNRALGERRVRHIRIERVGF